VPANRSLTTDERNVKKLAGEIFQAEKFFIRIYLCWLLALDFILGSSS
jgi:hypothetical protein